LGDDLVGIEAESVVVVRNAADEIAGEMEDDVAVVVAEAHYVGSFEATVADCSEAESHVGLAAHTSDLYVLMLAVAVSFEPFVIAVYADSIVEVFAGCCVAFVLLGVLDSVYGYSVH